MLVNLFVNVGIMLAAIYIYFSINSSTTRYQEDTWRQYVISTLCISSVGILQMVFSIVLSDIRLDFRGLLLAIAFKYFDLKTALSSLVILTLARFIWGTNDVALINLYNGFYLLISLPLLLHIMKERLSDSKQLIILVANTTLTTTVPTLFLVKDSQLLIQVITILWAVNFLLLFFSKLIIDDMSRMVDIINYDCLTNLNNQRRFQEDLKIIDKIDDSVSIALIDIDHFKQYNDQYGHEVGDAVLKKFATLLKGFIGDQANAYRVGGEEFVLIITRKSHEEAEELVHQLHEMILNTPFLEIEQDTILRPTLSIGLAHRELPEKVLDTYRRSDQAVYYCKRNGRNQVKVAKGPLGQLTRKEEAHEGSFQDRINQVGQAINSALAPQNSEVPEIKD